MGGRFVWIFASSFPKTALRRARHGPARPTWSLSFEAAVRALRRDWDETADWPLDRVRADVDARPYPKKHLRKVTKRELVLGGVPAIELVPTGHTPSTGEPVILFFHGGSFIYGSTRSSHGETLAHLATACGLRVVSVEYRLAPEHAYPAQREDAIAAFDALVGEGTPASSIVVAGDSAGGNLAIELQLALRDRGGPQAAAAVLLSPWVDLTMPGASFARNDPFDFGTREVLVRHAAAYAGGAALDDPRVSPRFADLAGLAPVFITAGEVEIPRDDIEAFAQKLRAAGVETTFHLAADMPHNAAFFADFHPSGAAVIDAERKFVAARTSRREAGQ